GIAGVDAATDVGRAAQLQELCVAGASFSQIGIEINVHGQSSGLVGDVCRNGERQPRQILLLLCHGGGSFLTIDQPEEYRGGGRHVCQLPYVSLNDAGDAWIATSSLGIIGE